VGYLTANHRHHSEGITTLSALLNEGDNEANGLLLANMRLVDTCNTLKFTRITINSKTYDSDSKLFAFSVYVLPSFKDTLACELIVGAQACQTEGRNSSGKGLGHVNKCILGKFTTLKYCLHTFIRVSFEKYGEKYIRYHHMA